MNNHIYSVYFVDFHIPSSIDEKAVTSEETEQLVDDEMKLRRDMYRQMRFAAENEDYERAAQLRDVLKELEKPAERDGHKYEI